MKKINSSLKGQYSFYSNTDNSLFDSIIQENLFTIDVYKQTKRLERFFIHVYFSINGAIENDLKK